MPIELVFYLTFNDFVGGVPFRDLEERHASVGGPYALRLLV